MQICMLLFWDVTKDPRVRKEKNSLEKAGHTIEIIDNKISKNLFLFNLKAIFYALKCNCDVYHAHDLFTLFPSALASFFKNKKLVYDAHELVPETTYGIKKIILKILEKILIKRATKIIASNRLIAEEIEKRYRVKDVKIIPNYTDIEEKFCEPEEIRFVYYGTISKDRKPEIIVKAMQNVKYGKLYIIGEGEAIPDIKKLIKKLHLENKVEIKKRMEKEKLADFLSKSYLGLIIYPPYPYNNYISLPNKLFECICCGLPVIASKLPLISEIVQNKAGLLCDPLSPDDIAQKINKLIEDKNLYRKFKENLKDMAKLYRWDKCEKELIEIYQNL